jgi:hypothetical protein
LTNIVMRWTYDMITISLCETKYDIKSYILCHKLFMLSEYTHGTFQPMESQPIALWCSIFHTKKLQNALGYKVTESYLTSTSLLKYIILK